MEENMGRRNPVIQLNEYYTLFREGHIDRRQLLKMAGTLGLSATALTNFARALPASAQDSSPTAAVFPGGFTSITREEYKARLAEDYPFTADPSSLPQGGTVIYGETASANLTTLNPVFANNSPTQDIVLLVFEQLSGLYPKGGADFVPILADYYEIAEDGLTYTFHLNPNANFHDGEPVTAEDVAFSLEAVTNEETGSSYTATTNATIASWNVVDEKTIEIVTTDVMAQLVFFANAFMPVVAKHIWEPIPFAEWQSDPGSTGQDPSLVVGSGPFKFQEINEAEGTATFVRNEDYYDDVPAIETLIFQTWPDDTAVIEALRAGDIDIVDSPPPADMQGLQEGENTETAVYDSYLFSWYGYNLDPEKSPYFQDVEVRQALIFALDRASMVENLYFGLAEVANGPQPVLSEAYDPDSMNLVYEYNPDRAIELLESAGWVEGSDGIREKDGVKLSFEIMYGAASINDLQAAALQDFWRAIGVEGQPTPVDFDTVLVPALTETFDFDMVMLAFDWASPNGDQSAMFGTEMYGAGFNAMRYSNPRYDELIVEANRELDPERRRELLIEASNIVNEEAPICVLWYRDGRYAYSARLQNFVPTANGELWSLPYVTVES
jgi:peptide/nickel transport system substrate-binding protein